MHAQVDRYSSDVFGKMKEALKQRRGNYGLAACSLKLHLSRKSNFSTISSVLKENYRTFRHAIDNPSIVMRKSKHNSKVAEAANLKRSLMEATEWRYSFSPNRILERNDI